MSRLFCESKEMAFMNVTQIENIFGNLSACLLTCHRPPSYMYNPLLHIYIDEWQRETMQRTGWPLFPVLRVDFPVTLVSWWFTYALQTEKEKTPSILFLETKPLPSHPSQYKGLTSATFALLKRGFLYYISKVNQFLYFVQNFQKSFRVCSHRVDRLLDFHTDLQAENP